MVEIDNRGQNGSGVQMIFKTFDSLLESGNKYDLLYADPPWKYDRDSELIQGCATNRAGAGEGYMTMSLEEIKSLPVSTIAEKNSVMCMWATGPKMDWAIEVMAAWQFTFKTVLFVWSKTGENPRTSRVTQSNYTLPSTEFVLLGTRGNGIKIPPAEKVHTIRQLQAAPTEGHSRKPAKFLRLIEQQFHKSERRLEMFARVGYPGWHLFGNQAEYQQVLV